MPAARRCSSTPTNGARTSPARRAGSTSTTTTRPWISTFMESVIWAFKQLWDKGLAYEGYRVLPYCWNDETPLSSHELRMDDDVYQSRQDPAITVGFRVDRGRPLRRAPTSWSGRRRRGRCRPTRRSRSTPTSPTSWCRPDDRRYVLAQARLAAYARELGEEPEVLATYTGRDLLGTRYLPPFPYFMDAPNTFSGAARRLRHAPRTAPASCTCRRPTARTTWRPPQAAGIVAVTPVDAEGPLRRDRARLRRPARVRRQPADHPRSEEPESAGGRRTVRCCCATRPTSTPTRTAGAAETR